jgi:hypothetical protein
VISCSLQGWGGGGCRVMLLGGRDSDWGGGGGESDDKLGRGEGVIIGRQEVRKL